MADVVYTADIQGVVGSVVRIPNASGVVPNSTYIGQQVTITGLGFGGSQLMGYVTIGGVAAVAYASWADTQVVCTVPAGAVTGDVLVWV